MRARGIAVRLFLSAWIVYGLHFATDIVREHYPAFALAERGTLRVDPYLGLHPDLFAIEGRGAYINNNPGASMLAGLAYAPVRPLVDMVVAHVEASRAARGGEQSAEYDEWRPNRVKFFREVRARGLDVRFGLAAGLIHVLFTAPISALGVVAVHSLLARLGFAVLPAVAFSLLYAFATPVFFRSGFLNQNMLVANLTLFAFALLFRPDRPDGIESARGRQLAAGLCLGGTLLCDYSGVVPILAVGLWALAAAAHERRPAAALGHLAPLLVGGAVPVAVLLGYQAWAFGNPFLPAQSYMPDTAYSGRGWFGLSPPAPDQLFRNLFDARYGLFAFCPLLLLAFAAPLRARCRLARQEWLLCLGLFAGLWLFASSVEYGRLQWNTGVRYLVPAVPFLFLMTASVLAGLPRAWAWGLALPALLWSWCQAMVRGQDVWASARGVLEGGFQLPWLTVLGKMGDQYLGAVGGWQPGPGLFLGLAALLLAGLWAPLRHGGLR